MPTNILVKRFGDVDSGKRTAVGTTSDQLIDGKVPRGGEFP